MCLGVVHGPPGEQPTLRLRCQHLLRWPRRPVQVVYVTPPLLYVDVSASQQTPGESEAVVTNTFTFSFVAPPHAAGRMRRVVPHSLAEALEYVGAHRRHAASGADSSE